MSRWVMLLIGIAELLLGGAALMLAWVTPTVDPFDPNVGRALAAGVFGLLLVMTGMITAGLGVRRAILERQDGEYS